MACRTSSVLTCSIVLSTPGGNEPDGNGMSDLIFRIEDIRPRFATVVISNVDPMRSYEYSASPYIIVNDVIIGAGILIGEIPACKRQTNILISYSKLHCTNRQWVSICYVNPIQKQLIAVKKVHVQVKQS